MIAVKTVQVVMFLFLNDCLISLLDQREAVYYDFSRNLSSSNKRRRMSIAVLQTVILIYSLTISRVTLS